MKLLRFLAIPGIPATQSICIMLAFHYEQWYGVFMLSAFIATDLLLIPFFSEQTKKIHAFAYSFLPLSLVPATFGLLFIIESETFRTIIIWANAAAQCMYVLGITLALFHPQWYQMRSLYHASHMLRLLLLYALSAIAFGLSYYADIPYWFTSPIIVVFVALLWCQALALYGIPIREHRSVIVFFVLGSTELFFAIALLPSIYFVNALLWTTIVSAGLQLLLSHLRKEQTRLEIMSTVAVSAVVVLLTVLTAQWR